MSSDRYPDSSPIPPAPPASFGGKGCGRMVLIGCGALAVLVILVMVAGGIWLNRNSDELEAGERLAAREAARFGLAHDEAACFEEGKRRAARSTTVQAGLAVGVFTQRCLEFSRETPGFCEGVPPITALRRSATWLVQTCGREAGCRNVAQMVQAYCTNDRVKRTAADTLLMNAADSTGWVTPGSVPAPRDTAADTPADTTADTARSGGS